MALTPITTKDISASLEMAHEVDAKVKECYRNCWRVVMWMPQYHDAHYVEGFYVSKRFALPLEHAFVLLADEIVIDPTWPEDDAWYFVGVSYTTDMLTRLIQTGKKTLPYASMCDQAYARIYQEVLAFSQSAHS